MIEDCRKILTKHAREWSLPGEGKWQAIVSNNYQPNYSTLALFWFHNGDTFPNVVTKVFQRSDIPGREMQSLRELHALAPPMVPRPLHFGPVNESWALWMEGVAGWPFDPLQHTSPAHLASIVDMVASIHAAVSRQGAAAPDRHDRMVVEPLHALLQFGQAESVRRGCERLRERCSKSWLAALPSVPQHGDCVTNNLLLHKKQWRLVDWENYGLIDLPFFDILVFAVSLLRGQGDTPECWDEAAARQVPELLRRYAQAAGQPDCDVASLLPLSLANWFQLQLLDGRRAFAGRMYQMLQHYFENATVWEKTFLKA